MREEEFVVTKKILRAHRQEEYESFYLVGRKGVGKTTFAVKIVTQIYMTLYKLSEDDAYKEALKVLFFDMNDVISFLKKYSGEQQTVMIWDDIRAHMSGYAVKAKPREAHEVLALMDTARDSVCGFISTSPSVKGVASFLKQEQGWLCVIRKDRNHNWRVCKGYLRFEIPSGTMRHTPRFQDFFYKMLPDWVYHEVKEKRRHYKEIAVKNIEDRIKQSQVERDITQLKNELEFIKKAV